MHGQLAGRRGMSFWYFCLGTKVPRHSAEFGTDSSLVCMYVARLCVPTIYHTMQWLHASDIILKGPFWFSSCQMIYTISQVPTLVEI